MGPEAWRRAIGESAWNHVRRRVAGADPAHADAVLAAVLDAAVECGFRAPERAPTVDPAGTKVLWGGIPVVTAEGLARAQEARGHGFFLLRAREFVVAAGGLLLPRLQELLVAYEEECRRVGKAPLPEWADAWCFVGGEGDPVDGPRPELWATLAAESPTRTVTRVHRAGPGAAG